MQTSAKIDQKAPFKVLLFEIMDLFVCAPSLVGAYYLRPPDARAIFLHNDLLCNGTCFVSGGRITYWGAETEKIRDIIYCFSLAAKF